MRFTKHHGLGNDFLVLLDLDDAQPVAPEQVAQLCDRRTGVGADGLVRVIGGTAGGDVTMQLQNADGSTAEMSGNAIQCLAQAVFQADLVPPPELRVDTPAGLRAVRLVEHLEPATDRMVVEMGSARLVGPEPRWVDGQVLQATRVDVGNPHVVLRWGGAHLPHLDELVDLGARIDDDTPGGMNVEVIAATSSADALDMVVYERGVGPTHACGTGACAAVAAAHEWGISGPNTTVQMPGGAVEVALGDPVLLTGETTSIAVVEAPWP